jgi:ABC-2 type transport system permease protein
LKYAWLVALREYGENARTKGFWIGILMFPIFLAIGIKVPRFLEEKARPTRYFAVVDEQGALTQVIDDELEERHQKVLAMRKLVSAAVSAAKQGSDAASAPAEPPTEAQPEPKRRFARVPLPPEVAQLPASELAAAVKPYLLGERKIEVDGKPAELFALIVLPPDLLERRSQRIEYWCANLADTDLREAVSDRLSQELRQREFLGKGVEPAEVERIGALSVSVVDKDPKKEAGQETAGKEDKLRQWAPVGFVYLLFVAIMTVAQMLLNNSVEEKSNRIVEVLLSSVTPFELMAGKLLGIAAIGMTMLAAWIASLALVVNYFAGTDGDVAKMIIDVLLTRRLLIAFAVYFVFGYLLYASLFLAVGSMCNTIKDAQNFMGPIMLVMSVPLFSMMFIPKDPHGTLAVVLSWIPPFTPFVMMNRAAASPPMWELVGTLVVLALSALACLWACARIFRVGILRTGQPPKLLELVSWLRG